MNLLDATLFGFTAWRLCLAAALLLMYLMLKIRWSKEAEAEAQAATVAVREASQAEDANKPRRALRAKATVPPVDLTDTQRIDHLHRSLSLKAGEKVDLKDLTFGRLPVFRVTFAGIEHASGRDFAHIRIELGGATADCGAAVQELGDNNFLMPRATSGDQCSVHFTCGKSDAVSFLQVKVPQFNAIDQSAAIDVMHVRGRRAA